MTPEEREKAVEEIEKLVLEDNEAFGSFAAWSSEGGLSLYKWVEENLDRAPTRWLMHGIVRAMWHIVAHAKPSEVKYLQDTWDEYCTDLKTAWRMTELGEFYYDVYDQPKGS